MGAVSDVPPWAHCNHAPSLSQADGGVVQRVLRGLSFEVLSDFGPRVLKVFYGFVARTGFGLGVARFCVVGSRVLLRSCKVDNLAGLSAVHLSSAECIEFIIDDPTRPP